MIRAYTAAVALLSLSIAEGLESQQSLAARAGVSVNATPNPIAQSSRDTTAAPDSTSGSRVLHGARDVPQERQVGRDPGTKRPELLKRHFISVEL